MEEIWKPVVGYEQYYAVSNFGRAKSLTRKKDKINYRSSKEIIHVFNNKDNYNTITLFLPKQKPKRKGVGRAILESFNPVPNMKILEVNHINGNKKDDRLENLEWVTSKENKAHAFKTGLCDHRRGEYLWNSKLKEEDVKVIKEELKHGGSLTKLGRKYNVTKHCIGRIKYRINWKHIGG
jgi:hypothetical protein